MIPHFTGLWRTFLKSARQKRKLPLSSLSLRSDCFLFRCRRTGTGQSRPSRIGPGLFRRTELRAQGAHLPPCHDRAALPESVPACSDAQNCVRRERISLPVMNAVSSSGSVRFRFAGSSKIRVLRFLRDQPEKKRRPAGRRCPWQGSCPAAFYLRAHPHGRLADRRWLSTCFQGLCGSQVHSRTLRVPKSMRKLPVSFFTFITLSPSALPSFGYTFLPSVRKRVPFLI